MQVSPGRRHANAVTSVNLIITNPFLSFAIKIRVVFKSILLSCFDEGPANRVIILAHIIDI